MSAITEVGLQYLVKFRSGQDYKHVYDEAGEVPVIGSGGPFATANAHLYDGESVLFGRKGTIDRPRHVKGKFWTVDTMFFTELGEAVDGRWLYYWATTIPYGLYSTDTALPSMTSSTLGRLNVPWVPLPTQKRIADYLDRETGEIDAMLGKMDELTETLEARRATAIDAALSAYPRHRLRFAISLSQTGPFGSQLSAAEYITGGVPLINPSHIKNSQVYPDTAVTVSADKAEQLSRHLLHPGDIVLGRKGEVDKAALVPSDLGPALCGSDSMLIRAQAGTCDSRFLWWFFQSLSCHKQLKGLTVGAAVEGLNQSAIAQLWMPLPPSELEQARIADHLDEVTGKIDQMLAKTAELKALLIERRAALITDVVTGKKQVPR